MSFEKYRPHVCVVPEDDANVALANGFLLHPKLNLKSLSVVKPAGGWGKVRDLFLTDYTLILNRYKQLHIILIIDFDGQEDRRQLFYDEIPLEFSDRVYVIGVWHEPEKLPKGLGSLETIGQALADDCCNRRRNLWDHEHLKHNSTELDKLFIAVQPILFQ